MSLRIFNAEPAGYSDKARTVLRELGEVVEASVTQRTLIGRVRELKPDALIVRLGLRLGPAAFEASARLRAVVTATTGLDHIDLAAAAARGVTVLSLQGETEFLHTVSSTAEHAWALILALARRIPWAFDHVRRGGWDRDAFRGTVLAGRRLGLLGLGRLGERVARYGIAFEMGVGAYDPLRRGWPKGVRRFSTLDALLRWSEVLSVHLPLTDETRGLLSRERLALLPRGAFVVNTARGALLDEAGLVALLEQGHLAGVAVDVLADEPPVGRRLRSPLAAYAATHENALITPHLGGATAEAMRRTELFMANKLKRFFAQRLQEARPR